MRRQVARRFEFLRRVMLLGLVAWPSFSAAQGDGTRTVPALAPSAESSDASLRVLQEQVRELQAAVAAMHSDWLHARAETAELRRELNEVRADAGLHKVALKNAISTSVSADVNSADTRASDNRTAMLEASSQDLQSDAKPDQASGQKENPSTNRRSASLEEEYQLLSGKVDDQYQTKVESASKYRLRLSGIVLMNLVSNQGVVDNVDPPTLAYAKPAGYPGGSFGATLRQSEIGFEAFGPNVAGARTRADLQLDLAGGFPMVQNGVNSGLMRLRTATMRMDWADTSLVVGQDSVFFSPISPTSFASLAVPALSAAGNLWGWIPQVRVEHRVTLSETSSLIFQAGILDPVSGERPYTTLNLSDYRLPGPGELSRQPAYATRIAWTRSVFGQPLHIGVGGFYSRQNYGFGRNIDGWAGMTDLELPLSSQLSLSGKFYRGKALGGLYGGIGRSVLFSGDPTQASTEVAGLNSIGGWAQLKYRPANKWEFNAAFGMDNPYARNLEYYFPYAQSYGDPTLARNQGSFVNVIYRPWSDLLFSAEYRHLTTYSLSEGQNNAGHLNLMMGILF